MHAILATLFAAIFSFCHASATQQAINQPESKMNDQAVFSKPVSSSVISSQTEPVYAEDGCTSCRKMMTASYSVR